MADWLHRHGWASRGADVALVLTFVAILMLDSQFGPEGRGLSVAAVLSILLACVPLLWRRRAPITVLWVITAGVFACLETGNPAITVVLPILAAIFSVGLYSTRKRTYIVAGITVVVVTIVMALYSEDDFASDLATNVGLCLLALAGGDVLRSRRAVLAAATEREVQRELEAQREAEQRLAEERLRIAREVHDTVAHAIVSINVQAGVGAHVLRSDPDQAERSLREIKRVSGRALGDLRSTLELLRQDEPSAPTRPVADLSDVGALAETLRAAGMSVELTIVGEPETVPAATGNAAYRIAQEALTNVLRHAGASSASVAVQICERELILDVSDDGAGVAGSGAGGAGHGLQGMRERASAIGGALSAGPTGDGGWRVHAALPFS